ncbi:hypothetical protein [Sphingorhabdus sp. M41]|uniref:hypothetical protein n=1 Tax=Sphingorhabdus sp. M41 TaxID=1806885 RepID=UPI0018D30521|nr:hypothetical protein [Sphingorhabdus sp. M41]
MPRYQKLLAIGATGALIAAGAGYLTFGSETATPPAGSFLIDNKAGFVITSFGWAHDNDASDAEACPNGMSKNVAEIFAMSVEGQRRPGETDEGYGERKEAGGRAISASPDGSNYCVHPELAPPDTHFRIFDNPDILVPGLDLDGKVSRSEKDVVSGLLDFNGKSGLKGIDNQFFRAVGCSPSYRPDGPSNQFEIEMLTGAWGMVVTLDDVDDLRNDVSVKVGLYANADPIQLSPTRVPLEYATYAMDQDPAYRATTKGRIKDGVLTTEPVDIQFRHVVNSIRLKRPLRDARIRATLSKDGLLKGILAGYTPVEAMYDLHFGFRNGTDGEGNPAPAGLRLQSSNGAARVLGYTCQGVYQALNRLADGHPDNKSGKYTSISTQYRFEARPAFVVDVDTKSTNEKLVRNE